jgi:dihydroneopterin aldolase
MESPAGIAIKKLQCASPIIAPNVWGLHKEQPASFDIHLHLNQNFASAADRDALDESTVHYGQLAKKIRAACTPGLGPLDALSRAEEAVMAMGLKSGNRFIIAEWHIHLHLPKASMYGDMLLLRKWARFDSCSHRTRSGLVFELQNLRFMGLIGVNDYERTGKQPIVATLCVIFLEHGDRAGTVSTAQHIAGLFALEKTLAQIVEESSFETLESLGDFATKALLGDLLEQGHVGAVVTIRLEKPKAIPFADAAVVEVRRTTAETEQSTVSAMQSERSGSGKKLNIIKPYK